MKRGLAVLLSFGMSWAVNAGLLSGKGSGMLDPGGTATRGEIAQILMNFCLSVAQ